MVHVFPPILLLIVLFIPAMEALVSFVTASTDAGRSLPLLGLGNELVWQSINDTYVPMPPTHTYFDRSPSADPHLSLSLSLCLSVSLSRTQHTHTHTVSSQTP